MPLYGFNRSKCMIDRGLGPLGELDSIRHLAESLGHHVGTLPWLSKLSRLPFGPPGVQEPHHLPNFVRSSLERNPNTTSLLKQIAIYFPNPNLPRAIFRNRKSTLNSIQNTF